MRLTESAGDWFDEANAAIGSGQLAGAVPFYVPDKITPAARI